MTPCSYDSSQEIIPRQQRLMLTRVIWPEKQCLYGEGWKGALENSEMQIHAVHFKQKHRGIFLFAGNWHWIWLIRHPERIRDKHAEQLLPDINDLRWSVKSRCLHARKHYKINLIVSGWIQLLLTKAPSYKSHLLLTCRVGKVQEGGRPGSPKRERIKGILHLHCLWRFPVQATCLCLLQRLRPSHPQDALELELAASRASFLVSSTSKKPWEVWLCRGCNTAVQMETAACISGSNSRDTLAAASLLWTVASFFLSLVRWIRFKKRIK